MTDSFRWLMAKLEWFKLLLVSLFILSSWLKMVSYLVGSLVFAEPGIQLALMILKIPMVKNGLMVIARGWSSLATLPSLSQLSLYSGLISSSARPGACQCSSREWATGSSTLESSLRHALQHSSHTLQAWTRACACILWSLIGGFQRCHSQHSFWSMMKPASSFFVPSHQAAGWREKPTTKDLLKLAKMEEMMCANGFAKGA